MTEYSKPFRTDVAWNVNARKFTYAPYFDFSENALSSDEKKRVAGYRFTVYMNTKTATTKEILRPCPWNGTHLWFVQLQEKCEKWMDEEALKTFDLRGQFKDVSVADIEPYENLTNCTATPYASYLLNKKNCSGMDIANAKDLIRLSEDRFVYWDVLRKADGTKAVKTSGVVQSKPAY